MTGNEQMPEAGATGKDADGPRDTERDAAGAATADAIADRVPDNWVDTHAPEELRPYLRLSRVDRPIGTWLLLLPCWWGALLGALSAPQTAGWLTVWIFMACGLGAVLMRGAGCTWNDITDRDIDPLVARTRNRPLAAGHVGVREALIWMTIQTVASFFHGTPVPGPGALALLGLAGVAGSRRRR